jgi:hypothetical protein
VIVGYIDAYRSRFGVEPICRVLSEHGMKIAPSTYYAALHARVSPAALADAYHANALVDLFRVNRSVYGARKLWPAMRRQGHQIGRDQVARLMGLAGLAGVVRGRLPMEQVVANLNRVLRGWGNYVRYGNSSRKFHAVDSYVRLRLARLASVKHGRPGRSWTTRYNYAWSQRLGVAWLVGTVRSGAVYARR